MMSLKKNAKGQYVVDGTAEQAASLVRQVRAAAERRGVSPEELQRRTGYSSASVNRFVGESRWIPTSLSLLYTVLRAIGVEQVREAAAQMLGGPVPPDAHRQANAYATARLGRAADERNLTMPPPVGVDPASYADIQRAIETAASWEAVARRDAEVAAEAARVATASAEEYAKARADVDRLLASIQGGSR